MGQVEVPERQLRVQVRMEAVQQLVRIGMGAIIQQGMVRMGAVVQIQLVRMVTALLSKKRRKEEIQLSQPDLPQQKSNPKHPNQRIVATTSV